MEKGDRNADLDQVSAEELIAAAAMWCPNPAGTSCLRVEGSSMSHLISNGDIVAVDRSQSGPGELSGKIVVVVTENSVGPENTEVPIIREIIEVVTISDRMEFSVHRLLARHNSEKNFSIARNHGFSAG